MARQRKGELMSPICPLCGKEKHKEGYKLFDEPPIYACLQCGTWIGSNVRADRPINVNGYHDRSRDIVPRYITSDKAEEEERLHMGMEIETDQDRRPGSSEHWSENGRSRQLNKELSQCGWMHVFNPTGDGSLHCGIEFVSQPATIGWWMEMKPLLAKGTEAIVRSGLRAHNTSTCGLHVHVSRSFFSYGPHGESEALLNLSIMVEQNWNTITQFARRGQSSYAKRQLGGAMRSEGSLKFSRAEAKRMKRNKDYDEWVSTGDRYQAVNYTNGRTIEFRFFKGTLNPNTIMATLQFVHNLCYIARTVPTELALEYTIQDVIGYRKYPELMHYAATLDLTSNKEAQYQISEDSE